MYVFIYACMYLYIHVCIYICMYMDVCIYIRICMYIYIYCSHTRFSYKFNWWSWTCVYFVFMLIWYHVVRSLVFNPLILSQLDAYAWFKEANWSMWRYWSWILERKFVSSKELQWLEMVDLIRSWEYSDSWETSLYTLWSKMFLSPTNE